MDEHKIIEGIISGDRESFKKLVDIYQPLVLNTCNSFLHDRQTAEDNTQEVFIEAYLSIHKFKKDAKLSTWLYRIAVNKSLNYIRDNKKRSMIKSVESMFKSDDINKADEDEVLDETEERLKVLHQVIDALPKRQKTAFTLCKLENLSYKEVAEIMSVPVTTVEGLMHRAKHSVQRRIEKIYQKKFSKP